VVADQEGRSARGRSGVMAKDPARRPTGRADPLLSVGVIEDSGGKAEADFTDIGSGTPAEAPGPAGQ
jgi:hypothetical protein